MSEILAESNVEARTILAFSVNEKAIEEVQWLPNGWKVAPPDSGPFKGSNLLVIFSDRLLVQALDKEGKPLPEQKTNQLAVVGVLAQHPEKQRGVIIAFGLSASSDGAPGPYNVFESSQVNYKKEVIVEASENSEVREDWSFIRNESGDKILLQLKCNRGTPARAIDAETRAYSAKIPEFCRIYRADQGVDMLQNNVMSQKDYTITGPKLGNVFDGSEKLISIISQPWTVRKVFV